MSCVLIFAFKLGCDPSYHPADEFDLEVHTDIQPEQNTSLEGLYKSGGNYCTQVRPPKLGGIQGVLPGLLGLSGGGGVNCEGLAQVVGPPVAQRE